MLFLYYNINIICDYIISYYNYIYYLSRPISNHLEKGQIQLEI